MKLKVSRDAIIAALNKVQSIVSTRTTLPILSNILLEAADGQLKITATDLEVSVVTTVDAEVKTAGATTLPARRTFSIFKELSASEIEIDVDDGHIASIQSGSAFFKLNGMSEEEFPPLPNVEFKYSYSIDQPVLKEMLQKTCYASSNDETRYILNGCLMSFKDEKMTMVATDGRRLALVEQEVEFPAESEMDLVVPTKTVNELVRTLGDKGTVEIRSTDKQIVFEFSDLTIISKLIDGTFPNFRQVVPSDSKERVAIERESLFAAIKRVAILTTDQSNSVKIQFSKNKIKIIASTPDIGEATEEVPIKYEGDDISMAFNPEFILDPLKVLVSDEVYFEFTDSLSPGVIKCDVPFLYVLMPMRVS